MKRKRIVIAIIICLSVCLPLIIISRCTATNNWERTKSHAAQALEYAKKHGMNTNYCFLVDFSVHSGRNRFYVWSFKEKKILYQGLVAHGEGKGSTMLKPEFSNQSGSNCSSLGRYRIGIRSYSNWGIHAHYKMHGLDKTNSNAYQRQVVLHSYALLPSVETYPAPLPLGYSKGCPVISNKLMTNIDNLLQKIKNQPPVLLWIYS